MGDSTRCKHVGSTTDGWQMKELRWDKRGPHTTELSHTLGRTQSYTPKRRAQTRWK